MNIGETVFYVLEIIGVFAFALSGAITAIKRNLDVFGVIVLGITTAMGGGMVRDILIGNFPPSMFYSIEYVMVAAVTALLVFILAYILKSKFEINIRKINFVNNIFDAIGLGVFSILGVSIAISAGYEENALLCIFLGTMTGVGGGVLRDVMSRSIPLIFTKHIYALASILGCVTYYYSLHFGLKNLFAIGISMLVTFILRMIATAFKWSLPKVKLVEDD